jgi:hypothetical protein
MWLELHQAVWTHRKTFELASMLGLDETYAAAHVIRLWSWALDNAPDGDLSALSARAIAYGAGWRTGSPDAFVRALVEVGWLDADNRIHDWHVYAGRLVERRREDAERKRMSRGHPPDGTIPSGRTAAGVRRTGPDRTLPDTTGPEYPPNPPQAGGAPLARRQTRGRSKSNGAGVPAEPVSSLTAEEIAAWQQPQA